MEKNWGDTPSATLNIYINGFTYTFSNSKIVS